MVSFWDSDATAAEADFGPVVSVWSARCLSTWTVCLERGRMLADDGGRCVAGGTTLT